MGHQFLAGQNFSAKTGTKERDVIVNEQVIKRLAIGNGDPLKAVGEWIVVNGQPLQIIVHYQRFSIWKNGDSDQTVSFSI